MESCCPKVSCKFLNFIKSVHSNLRLHFLIEITYYACYATENSLGNYKGIAKIKKIKGGMLLFLEKKAEKDYVKKKKKEKKEKKNSGSM